MPATSILPRSRIPPVFDDHGFWGQKVEKTAVLRCPLLAASPNADKIWCTMRSRKTGAASTEWQPAMGNIWQWGKANNAWTDGDLLGG